MAPDRLLTIGEFSRLAQLSIRMLRHYDERGVLRPTRVDEASGYRYYAPELLGVARRLRALRDVGLGVAQLAEVAPFEDTALLRAVLLVQRDRLVAEAAAASERLKDVDHLITQLEERTMSTPVTTRTLPARTVASVRGIIPTYADEGLLWQRLMAGLPATGARIAQQPLAVAVFHDQDYSEHDADVEVRLDVAAPFADAGDVRSLDVPATEIASGMLHGPFEGIGVVMEDLGTWIAEHGQMIAGPMFNIYLVGPQATPDASRWLTEVCVPIAPAS
jgi:DNA-binding transcriptional MerR regulator